MFSTLQPVFNFLATEAHALWANVLMPGSPTSAVSEVAAAPTLTCPKFLRFGSPCQRGQIMVIGSSTVVTVLDFPSATDNLAHGYTWDPKVADL